MPSFPHPGSVTVCEINRDLITAENLSEDQAKETYGKVLGVVFSPIPYQIDYPASLHPDRGVELPVNRLSRLLQAVSYGPLKSLLGPDDVKLLAHVDLKCVSWHQKKDILAFISARNQVTIRDYGDSGEGKDPCILMNDLQREAKLLEWRPNAGKTLSVGCKGGICIWSASYPGNTACVRPGVNSGSRSRGSGVRWTLVDFLRGHGDEQISALSWSPDGRYVASASYESSSFTIWDFAQGVGTPIRRGLGKISLLKWSPTRDYFFAAKFDGTFYLWETNTWTSELWSSTSGFVTGAAWDPNGRMILIAFSESLTLGSVHFATKPPSLDAHLLPVDLPELKSLTNSGGIEKIAWDATGERLAVSYKDGNEVYKGLIAIYDVKRATIITPSLVGFIRGPGEDPKPLTFSFHDKYKQGPLLSVVWSTGCCVTYPLLIRSHLLA
ncbi:aladin [Lactuca sativa]|uniref:aladin n=1 Tax=Lactuca sativa TaxID=4236 RepID=UPI000CD9E0D1|nr:aladin [Lactuca sativa]